MSATNSSHSKGKLANLTLGAIGVVFGDIGTSPLYALKEVFLNGLPTDATHVFGVLSLIFWTLMLVVTCKYAIFIMRANNKGEGGIMAIMALAMLGSTGNPKRQTFIITIGLLGAALFYGDGIITPAISVLSAVEGLQVIEPSLEHFVVPITMAVLSLLFLVQAKGTDRIGKMFSPVMIVWFIAIGLLGLINILDEPEVLQAINPVYGLGLLVNLGWKAFVIMGSVVLAITGAEALYADMGHFGLKPIRYAWFWLVFPSLLLNYFGQGALLIANPAAIENPFYLLAPNWAMYPMLILAALATVIASQAVISGAFSLTRQAIQLGYCPRMTIMHTSGDEMGQVYVPAINWLLMVSVFILVLGFKSSTALASAYGLAVTGTMIVTTTLAFIVIQSFWQWSKSQRFGFLAVFLTIDIVFFASNCLKIPSGGWLPLVVGLVLFLILSTWIKGKQLFAKYLDDRRVLFEDLNDHLNHQPLATVPGAAIYMARSLHGVPQVLLHNLEHNHVLHETVVVLTIVTKEEFPMSMQAQRGKIRVFRESTGIFSRKTLLRISGGTKCRALFGGYFAKEGLAIDQNTTSFFMGSENISRSAVKARCRNGGRHLFPLFNPQFHKRHRIFQVTCGARRRNRHSDRTLTVACPNLPLQNGLI